MSMTIHDPFFYYVTTMLYGPRPSYYTSIKPDLTGIYRKDFSTVNLLETF